MPRKYINEMEEATSRAELYRIAHDALMDKDNAYPRHHMATLASVYRDNFHRLTK